MDNTQEHAGRYVLRDGVTGRVLGCYGSGSIISALEDWAGERIGNRTWSMALRDWGIERVEVSRVEPSGLTVLDMYGLASVLCCD